MIAIRFNKFERVAGLFVMLFIISGLGGAVTVAIKRDWFANRFQLITEFENGDGLHVGTEVLIAGLRAGAVEKVELLDSNKIRVTFNVLESFRPKVRKDSVAQLIRPFVIGERVLEITVGDKEQPIVSENDVVGSYETMDLMTLLSGRRLGNYLEGMSQIAGSVKTLMEAFAKAERTESFVRVLDQIEPLVVHLNDMSVEVVKLSGQATRKDNLGTVLGNLSTTTKELNRMLPVVMDAAPDVGRNIEAILKNLVVLTDNFKLLTPTIVEIAPSLPKTSRRAVEALDEAVILLKALQKSMLVRGNVQEVREEESHRQPANDSKDSSDQNH